MDAGGGFEEGADFPELLAEGFEVGAVLFGVGGDEPGGEEAGEHAEEADAGAHQDAGDEAAFGGDRIAVAVADRGDGRQGPPDRVFGGLDVRGRVGFDVQDRDAGEGQEQQREERGGEEAALAAFLEHEARQNLRRAHPAQHPHDTRDARRAPPPRHVERRNARQQIEPSPRVEIPPPVLRAIQADEEVRQEQHAHRRIRIGEQVLDLTARRIRRLHAQRRERIDAQREHEQLIRRRAARRHELESCISSRRSRQRDFLNASSKARRIPEARVVISRR